MKKITKKSKRKNPLTTEDLGKILSRPKIDRRAVYNFLISPPINGSLGVDLENLELDKKLYKWNEETVTAIADGIYLKRSDEIQKLTKINQTLGERQKYGPPSYSSRIPKKSPQNIFDFFAKGRAVKKNPLIINEGNIRKWLFLNYKNYKNMTLDLSSMKVMWSKMEKDLAGTYIGFYNHHFSHRNLFRNYVILLNDINNTPVSLSNKEKFEIWRFYTMDHPEAMSLLKIDRRYDEETWSNWLHIYKGISRFPVSQKEVAKREFFRMKREGKTRYRE